MENQSKIVSMSGWRSVCAISHDSKPAHASHTFYYFLDTSRQGLKCQPSLFIQLRNTFEAMQWMVSSMWRHNTASSSTLTSILLVSTSNQILIPHLGVLMEELYHFCHLASEAPNIRWTLCWYIYSQMMTLFPALIDGASGSKHQSSDLAAGPLSHESPTATKFCHS